MKALPTVLFALCSIILLNCAEVSIADLNPDDFDDGGGGGGTKTFATDVAPVLNQKCGAICHFGATAPDFTLTGDALYAVTQPVADTLTTAPSTGHQTGPEDANLMTSDEAAAIRSWAEAGAQNN